MATPLTPEQIERLAHRRARSKLGWYMHAAVYVLVNSAFYAMAEFGVGSHRWSMAPTIGWGVGLALHGISVFVLGRGSGLRERMVQKERERIEREQQGRF